MAPVRRLVRGVASIPRRFKLPGRVSTVLSILVHLALLLVFGGVYFLRKAPPPLQIYQVKLMYRGDAAQGRDGVDEKHEPESEQADPADVSEQDRPVDAAKPDHASGAADSDPAEAVQGLHEGSGSAETAKGLASRTGLAKIISLQRWGGSRASEDAVQAGLRWLVKHQDADGKWSCKKFALHCPTGDRCSGPGRKKSSDFDAGVSGLAILAFLGAGHTHQSGEYKRVVSRGLDYVLALQASNGAFSGEYEAAQMYHQGICTLVLAEAYRMTGDVSLLRPLTSAVRYIVQAQQNAGGWDYTQHKTGRSDMSVTGWQVMALRSAEDAGVDIPADTILRLRGFLRSMTEESGYVRYADKGAMLYRKGNAMVAVSLLCWLYTGLDVSSNEYAKAVRIVADNPPLWRTDLKVWSTHTRGKRTDSMYYWYYGTLDMFHVGGRVWEQWNRHLQAALIPRQVSQGHARGSWDPVGTWGWYGGRVYATAMNILSLEVFYRYLPMHAQPPAIARFVHLIDQGLRAGDHMTRLLALKEVRRLPDSLAVPFLLRASKDDNGFVKFHSAQALWDRRQEVAWPVFRQCLNHRNTFIRSKTLDTLAEMQDPAMIPLMMLALDDPEEFIRRRANQYLVMLAGTTFGLEKAEHIAGEKARLVWEAWLHEHQPSL